MARIVGPPKTAIRNKSIAAELRRVLARAADAVGVETVQTISGGQTDDHDPNLKNVPGGWTGSRRHDNGRAADLQLIQGGRTLTFTNKDGREVEAFVTAAAARGATGIGAGVDYMGPRTLHIGFGTSPSDHGELTWGKNGQSANAPAWLRKAAQKGWDNPAADADEGALAPRAAGRFTVISRDGLNLRKGPGLGFGITKILETGTEVTVRGFDGPDGEWARVDLEDDGLVDGHVLAAFLAHADRGEDSSEDVEEPD